MPLMLALGFGTIVCHERYSVVDFVCVHSAPCGAFFGARCAFLGSFLVCGAQFLGSISVHGAPFWVRFWCVAF